MATIPIEAPGTRDEAVVSEFTLTREQVRNWFDNGDPFESLIDGFEIALDEAQGNVTNHGQHFIVIRITD